LPSAPICYNTLPPFRAAENILARPVLVTGNPVRNVPDNRLGARGAGATALILELAEQWVKARD